MPLSKNVTHDKSKMISCVTIRRILHSKGAFNYKWVIQYTAHVFSSLLQITVDEEIARLYIVK